MAEFLPAFQAVLQNEGGYGNDPSDPGGETYKGIARKMNSKWDGWLIIDLLRREASFPANLDNNLELQGKIKDFYRINYWDKVSGDQITNQQIATSIFDFAVNAGVSTSSTLAQMVADVKADGVLGENSIKALNAMETELFLAQFTIAKIARYVSIVKKRPESKKYFYGWIRRALGDN